MYNQETILLVDDEQGLLDLLSVTLKKERYANLFTATTAAGALALVQQKAFDLILLDVMLPDFSGFELCREIRKHTFAPIIFVSACDTDFDKLTGLSIGGDDYITKPFNPLEVVARIKAILRRQQQYKGAQTLAAAAPARVFEHGVFRLDVAEAILTVGGQPVDCTAKELELLEFFCQNPGRVFTAGQIYEAVWDEPVFGADKTVAMHISRLRKKLGDTPPALIVNLRGIGYKFMPPKEKPHEI